MNTVTFQHELRPALPNVYGCADYREFRDTLAKIDEILIKTGLEDEITTAALDQFVNDHQLDSSTFYHSKNAEFHYKKIRYALRCNIARHLTGESYRLFSMRLADSELIQWFTGISVYGHRKAISKSSLDRYEKYFDQAFISEKIRRWLSGFSDKDKAQSCGLEESISFNQVLIDSTCVKANIHFPVDWVLLRDAVRSLLLAITCIRAQGLKNRMIDPTLFMKQMNKYCISMTHCRRRRDSKKQRKTILRTMKKLTRCIAKHGQRYRDLLVRDWEKTDWSKKQAQQVIRRIEAILDQLPVAIQQAHDRIIGERKIPSSDKILSLYDKDVRVIVRGKAGSEVEFGQKLLLSEQHDGLIVDWKLFSEQPSCDSKILGSAIDRIEKHYGHIHSISADRAFWSKAVETLLQKKDIYNAICPKSPKRLEEKLTEDHFVLLQTRRSQTEARIGIFKNVFLGKPLRTRITANKHHAINWCVLTHNLWVLSRQALADERARLEKAA